MRKVIIVYELLIMMMNWLIIEFRVFISLWDGSMMIDWFLIEFRVFISLVDGCVMIYDDRLADHQIQSVHLTVGWICDDV